MDEHSPQGKVFTELVLEIFLLHGLLLEAGDRMTQPIGLSSACWQVLGVVEHGNVPVAHVARVMGLARQSVQRTANLLEQGGFITFLENPQHQRAKLMGMTSKGRKALDDVQPRQAEWADQLAGEHPPDALQTAVRVLRGARKNLERAAAPEARNRAPKGVQ